jgi:hypothetical protein
MFTGLENYRLPYGAAGKEPAEILALVPDLWDKDYDGRDRDVTQPARTDVLELEKHVLDVECGPEVDGTNDDCDDIDEES